MDPKARVIVAVQAEPATGSEADCLADIVTRARFAGHTVAELAADSGYASETSYATLDKLKASALIPPGPAPSTRPRSRPDNGCGPRPAVTAPGPPGPCRRRDLRTQASRRRPREMPRHTLGAVAAAGRGDRDQPQTPPQPRHRGPQRPDRRTRSSSRRPHQPDRRPGRPPRRDLPPHPRPDRHSSPRSTASRRQIFQQAPRRPCIRTGSASAGASATSAGGAACCRTTSPPVQPVRTWWPKFGPAAGRNASAGAVACAPMEKPKTTAPPRHRRYPRGAPKAAETDKAGTTRRWPRAVSGRRVFPRG